MTSTANAIMDTAQHLLQTRGYHAFSYRDIATVIGVRTASIHYHFPTKEALASAVASKVLAEFKLATEAITASMSPAPEQLRAFSQIFQTTFGRGDRLCPMCMLATGQDAVPPAVSAAVREFWLWSEAWLQRVLILGIQAGQLRPMTDPGVVAQAWLGAIEGSMITARVLGQPARLTTIIDYLLAQVEPDGQLG
jgi:TetR/AcrR family transcriptional regulator, transcriptional repressor for nem operon